VPKEWLFITSPNSLLDEYLGISLTAPTRKSVRRNPREGAWFGRGCIPRHNGQAFESSKTVSVYSSVVPVFLLGEFSSQRKSLRRPVRLERWKIFPVHPQYSMLDVGSTRLSY
jgi:hypothetical protein